MAMHQPNYLPWIGYFYKISSCDIFVYLDAIQFPRGRNYSARTTIKTANGPITLSIPVSKPKGLEGKAYYNQIAFADTKWKKKHLKTIYTNYKKCFYFSEIYDIIEEHILNATNILDLNINLIESIVDYLKIKNKRVRLSHLSESFAQKNDLIIDICQKVEANFYLSGTGGGKEYNNEQALNNNNISLRYLKFKHPDYPQIWGKFKSNLSIVDMLFNCGLDSRKYFLQNTN
ncbi:WbqC family protein [Desulfonatronovibrio magnus]|uniref:WbqC family protein n=1 Tax=Desulfonatronovibrio magnus TaxID=698827 RepID=UPI000699051B|nr:WbqC family protein [Desulfonatronovibrio magnus]